MIVRKQTVEKSAWCGGALVVGVFLTASGCASREPVFPLPDEPLFWPEGPEPPRYRWVGELRSEADLKRPRSVWEWFGAVWGGTAPPTEIQAAHGVVVTPAEVLFVSDPDARVVHRFDLKNRSYRAIEDAGGGRSFVAPIGLALSGDRLYVADRGLKTVTVLSEDGEPGRVVGEGLLEGPVGLAVGPVSGRLWVADVLAHAIKVFDPSGDLVLTVGGRGVGPGEFNYPTHVACDAEERVYVTDTLNCRVQVLDRDGRYLFSWGRREDTPGNFGQPKGVACSPRGHVYVVDSRFENVQVFTRRGELLLSIGGEGTAPGKFWLPVGIFADANDNIWVGDSHNHRVQKIQYLADAGAGVEP